MSARFNSLEDDTRALVADCAIGVAAGGDELALFGDEFVGVFWKNPNIDFWFFMFWVLDDDFRNAGVDGIEEEGTSSFLAIVMAGTALEYQA